MKRLFVRSLALLLASLHLAASAAVDARFGEIPKLAAPQNYFVRCENILESLAEGNPDLGLVNQIGSDEQVVKLLSDYGLIFTQQFQDAVKSALRDRKLGLEILTTTTKDSRWKLVLYTRKLHKLYMLKDSEFDKFVGEVMAHFNALSSASADGAIGEVRALQMKRLSQAFIDASKQAMYANVLRAATKLTILSTFKSLRTTLAADARNPYREPIYEFAVRVLIPGTIGVGGMLLLALNDMGMFVLVPVFFALALSHQQIPFPQFGVFARYSRDAKKLANINLGPINSLTMDYLRSAEDAVLSLEQVCKGDVCKMTPVQLAYAGHLDLLRLRADYTMLVELSSLVVPPTEAIRLAAYQLADTPSSKEAQDNLTQLLTKYRSDFDMAKIKVRGAVSALGLKIQEVQGYFTHLQSTSNEILKAKLQTDLQTIERLRFDEDEALSDIRQIELALNGIGEFTVFATEDQWRERAENVIMAVDMLPAGAQP